VAGISAVDVSDAMLEQLAAKPELQGKVEALCHDLTLEALDRRFDLIVSAMALHHVEDTALLLRRFAEHLNPGGGIALADLDAEDGSFHEPGTEGVYHQGFERESLAASLRAAGFEQIAFTTAHTITKDAGRSYTVFLLTAIVGGP
jgi:2-polyprenyl-3-methyl-5-hydroxy-6-metoxy-1,4-benzoquinol methylase